MEVEVADDLLDEDDLELLDLDDLEDFEEDELEAFFIVNVLSLKSLP